MSRYITFLIATPAGWVANRESRLAEAIQHGEHCILRKHSVIGVREDQLALGAIVHLVQDCERRIGKRHSSHTNCSVTPLRHNSR
jgi:hypothetical protein